MTILDLIRAHGGLPAKHVKLNGRRVEYLKREVRPGDAVTWTTNGLGMSVLLVAEAAPATEAVAP